MLRRRVVLHVVFATCGLAAMGGLPDAFAANPITANVDAKRVAISGYDVVAYHALGRPVRGDRRHEVIYGGARYWFSSSEHADYFRNDPERFLPKYGGFCSYGVAAGKKLDVDPEAWAIVDGQLYLQLDLGTQLIWRTNRQKYIAVADRIWPAIKLVPASELDE